MNRCGQRISVILCWAFSVFTVLGAEKETVAPGAMEVKHSPKQPRSGQAVIITASPQTHFASASLEYQIVEPGAYVALKDSEYKSRWVSLHMRPNATEGTFSAEIPSTVQTHRRLVRYRIKGVDNGGRTIISPNPRILNRTSPISFMTGFLRGKPQSSRGVATRKRVR